MMRAVKRSILIAISSLVLLSLILVIFAVLLLLPRLPVTIDSVLSGACEANNSIMEAAFGWVFKNLVPPENSTKVFSIYPQVRSHVE